ncbi:HD domain-containing protein [Thermanaerosceptrum fracticalcis]|uniref:HD domain-containing protein n=1 Tax=Thermanaerosceptrum fracticalcis TaxID=1712410 RepID=A0A7G6E3W4_THEFR|nr:HD-GYP domain-containing protein [Thermanaerosceptrum fracticalcis]QNB46768.1 HD domain-containing protein [Thermanaerosceptrum fracticalcis]
MSYNSPLLVVDTKNSAMGTPLKIDNFTHTFSGDKEGYDKKLYTNDSGKFIRAFAPLKKGETTVGLVGVDVNAHFLVEDSKKVKNYIIYAFFFLTMLFSFTNFKLAEILENRKELFDGSINSLVDSINAKDNYTRDHSVNVAYYSTLIAEELGFSASEIRILGALAKLHDIGKIGIRDDILSRPGKLSKEEYEIIKLHPVIGAQILSNIKEAQKYLSIVRNHHERFDGEGYPDGLRGEEIPLMARIVAVADTFDAMTTNRPYRGALPVEAALKELEKNKGSQFDPQVVDAFIKVMMTSNVTVGAKSMNIGGYSA